MRITSLSGKGLLSLDDFALGLPNRVTFVVGPNGAGKSNTARLLSVTQRALEAGDSSSREVDRQLFAFVLARHVGSTSPGIEVRVAVKLTDPVEQTLMTEFIRSMVTGALLGSRAVENQAQIDEWADSEITVGKLQPLMEGEIVTRHPGTEDGQWTCAYEFTAASHDGSPRRYRWNLLGFSSGTIVDAEAAVPSQGVNSGVTVVQQYTGSPKPQQDPAVPVPGSFKLLTLLPGPSANQPIMGCTFHLSQYLSTSQRRFAQMTGLPLNLAGNGRPAGLATVLRVILRLALVHTSDQRLLPSGGTSWSSSHLALVDGAEARLPELLMLLKNGNPAERSRYRRLQELFTEFTQGRGCEVRLMQVPQTGQDGQPLPPSHVPAIWVTISARDDLAVLVPEVPIELAGAGAWEALVLASALAEPAASVVVLDEPAVALHTSLQRQLGAYLLEAPAQFLVITHSAELLPLAEAADVQLVRLDRDDKNATQARSVDDACRRKMTPKLKAKGNERLPFAGRAILCEGQDDVEAIMTLSERIGIDPRRRNIAVTDCGGRENLGDYAWFCTQLGIRYLAVMDGDAATPAAQNNAQAAREAVSHYGGGELFEFPHTLEATFRVGKQKPSLVPGKIRELPFAGKMPDPAQAPAEVVKLAEAIRSIAGQAACTRASHAWPIGEFFGQSLLQVAEVARQPKPVATGRSTSDERARPCEG